MRSEVIGEVITLDTSGGKLSHGHLILRNTQHGDYFKRPVELKLVDQLAACPLFHMSHTFPRPLSVAVQLQILIAQLFSSNLFNYS